MESQGQSKLSKVVSVIIIFILIIAVAILFYQNTQNKIDVETKLNELESQMNEVKEQENAIKNQMENDNETNELLNGTTENEVNETNSNEGETTKEQKKFTFNTPVGESGVFEVYAEKALQASGFSGASAHIFYLKGGVLYYHNGEKTKDTKLADGIMDLKQQGEEIIAVKGKNAKVYTDNSYIQYQ